MSSIRVELKVLGERIAVEAPQPPESVRLDEALPLLRAIDDRAIDIAVRRVENEGKAVSCRRGCSACCRSQPVPVTPPEAYALMQLVEALPEPRRSVVKQRFADNVEQLRAAGLLPVYRRETPVASPAQAREVARRYFQLKLVCPFLEDDACGIYLDRPFVCRQYLVTSPAELCADPFANPVEPVPVPLRPASAMLSVGAKFLGAPQYSVPLTLALELAERQAPDLGRVFPAQEVFKQSVALLRER